MGEKEQGGMLRNVVILGLIALISAVVIVIVVGLNHKMNVVGTNTVNAVDRTGKEYNTGLEEMKHFDKYNNISGWGGKWLYMPKVGNIEPKQWREYRFDLKVPVKTAITFDINAYPVDKTGLTIPSSNSWSDSDDWSKRSIVATNTSNGHSFDILKNGGSMQHFEAEPNVVYHFDVKYYNNKSYTLKDVDGGASSALSVATQGQAFQIQVTNLEAATYGDDIE